MTFDTYDKMTDNNDDNNEVTKIFPKMKPLPKCKLNTKADIWKTIMRTKEWIQKVVGQDL